MLNKICNKICDYFISIEIIPQHNKQLYEYGLQHAVAMLAYIIFTIVVGVFLQITWHSIIFLLSFVPIRTYAGGFHSKSAGNCCVLSVILVIAILLVMKMIEIPLFICIAGITLSSICIILLAPVQDPNKPFTKKEKTYFRKKTRIFLFAEVIICILGFFFHRPIVYICIFVSLATISVMLILGKIKNHFVEKNI